jgi:hypothetical protein
LAVCDAAYNVADNLCCSDKADARMQQCSEHAREPRKSRFPNNVARYRKAGQDAFNRGCRSFAPPEMKKGAYWDYRGAGDAEPAQRRL